MFHQCNRTSGDRIIMIMLRSQVLRQAHSHVRAKRPTGRMGRGDTKAAFDAILLKNKDMNPYFNISFK